MVLKGKGFVYMLMNRKNTVVYTGVTSNLMQRIFMHKQKSVRGFTEKYNVGKLVYFEEFDSIVQAIENEKRIKAGSRAKKIALIKIQNPDFRDLYET